MRHVHPGLAVLTVACCAVLVACSPPAEQPVDGGTSAVRTPQAEATASDDGDGDGDDPAGAQALEPLTAPPATWSGLTLGPVTLDVPDGFTQVDEPQDTTARLTTWVARYGDQDGARAAISVARDLDPQRDASGTADAALQAERAQRGVDDDASSALTWPGADAAHHLTYLQDVAVGGTRVSHRAEWVYADLPDGTQVAVGVLAPVDLFDELALHDVLATWRTGP
ncbi:hypothetical protein [Cellulomonas sp. S1-8]|uniref:hypothetical protein n=1 Tax=Cellulomonas sp. S1-8 TaxID=2904790 RepID=UPI002242DFD2|nr:hypothetical protein [Cellulomonas sp. S1-8]UZN02150.1 hypothetical protein OKX07_13775 [Cellulomonas sp. S1-8]